MIDYGLWVKWRSFRLALPCKSRFFHVSRKPSFLNKYKLAPNCLETSAYVFYLRRSQCNRLFVELNWTPVLLVSPARHDHVEHYNLHHSCNSSIPLPSLLLLSSRCSYNSHRKGPKSKIEWSSVETRARWVESFVGRKAVGSQEPTYIKEPLHIN